MQSGVVVIEAEPQEAALRKLPLTYSLALRLRAAGVAPDIICEYLRIEENALPALYRVAEGKLAAAGGKLPLQPQTHCVDDGAAQGGWNRSRPTNPR